MLDRHDTDDQSDYEAHLYIFGIIPPSKRTTPARVVVLIWCAIIFSVGVGAYCLWIGSRIPPDEAEYAHEIQLSGLCFLAAGPLIWLVHRLIARRLHR